MRTIKKINLNVLFFFIILLSPNLNLAATYYVDFEGGKDSNTGTSKSSPLKRCPGDRNYSPSGPAPISLQPGDTVMFKGGITYIGNIEMKFNGSDAGGNITYRGNSEEGDWGIGKGIISGLSGATFLTNQNKNTIFIVLDNLEITNTANSGARGISDGGEITYKKEHIVIKNCYIHDMNSFTDTGCDVDGKGIYFGRADNITIHNNIFERTGYNGIYFTGDNDTIKIYDNIFTDQILWVIAFRQTYGDVKNVHIFSNTMYNCNYVYDAGYSSCGGKYHSDWIYFFSVNANFDFSNVFIHDNNLYNTIDFDEYGGTAMVFIANQPSDTEVEFNNIQIYNNVFYNAHGQAVQLCGIGTYYVYNNTIIMGPSTLRCFYSYSRTNSDPPVIDLKNNIMVKYGTYAGVELGRPSQGNDPPILTSSYNIYKIPKFKYNGLNKTWNEWQGFGYDVNGSLGLDTNPLFVDDTNFPNYSSDDLRLQNSSPAKDAGTTLSSYFSNDLLGVERPQGFAWDIGVYEFQAGNDIVKPLAPTNLRVISLD